MEYLVTARPVAYLNLMFPFMSWTRLRSPPTRYVLKYEKNINLRLRPSAAYD